MTKPFENMLQQALGPKVFGLNRCELRTTGTFIKHCIDYICFSSVCTVITVIKTFDGNDVSRYL